MRIFWITTFMRGLVATFVSITSVVAQESTSEQGGATAASDSSGIAMMGKMDPAMKKKCKMMMKIDGGRAGPGTIAIGATFLRTGL